MRTFTIFILTTLLTTLPLSANDNDMSDKELALQIIQEKTPEFPNQEQTFIQTSLVSNPELNIEHYYQEISAERFLQVLDSWLDTLEDNMLKKLEARIKEQFSQNSQQSQQIILESLKPTVKMLSTRVSTVLSEVLPAKGYPARFIIITDAIFLGFFEREALNNSNSILTALLLPKEMISTRSLSLQQKKDLLRRASNEHLENYSRNTYLFRQMLSEPDIARDPEARQMLERLERIERRTLEKAAQKSYDVALETALSSPQTNNLMEFITIAVDTYQREFKKHADEWGKTVRRTFENMGSPEELKEKSQKKPSSCPY